MKKALLLAATIFLLPFEGRAQQQIFQRYNSAGAGQFGLPITSGTKLTVPTNTLCAYITVEGASVRRTSDGTTPTTTNGTLISSGTQWPDCGPLSSYQFTAVSGSPTLDAEYFK
jgi:hypothetical protein